MVQYFGEYSLDNKHIQPTRWHQYSKDELINKVVNSYDDNLNQIIAQRVVGTIDADIKTT